MNGLYNLISLVSFVIIILTNCLLKKTSKSFFILRLISLILFLYKIIYYVIENIRGIYPYL